MASASQHKRAERGGKRKKSLSRSSVGDVCARPRSVQYEGGGRKGGTITLTKYANGAASELINSRTCQINPNYTGEEKKKKSTEKIRLTTNSNIEIQLVFF